MAPRRWALITGVNAGGMGEAHLQALIKRNINVIATAIDLQMLVQVVSSNERAEVVKLQLDVTSQHSIASTVEQVAKITGGKLHFLFNNAGYGYYMPLLDVDIDKAKKQYDVNLWGVLAVTQAFFPLLRAAKGTVINQSSVAGVQGFNRPYMGIYSSSKAAVYSLSDTMRIELSPFDIKVVTLVTGAVKTEFFNNKEGGPAVTLPLGSVYSPIRSHVETMLQGSLSGGRGDERLAVTVSTVASLLRWSWFRTRYIRRGFGAIKIWLMYLWFPTWLMDRWARKSGALDQLRKMLR